jgi:serine/threonine protein kinase
MKQSTRTVVAIKVFAKSSTIAKALYESEIKAYKALRGQAGILQHQDDGETDDLYFIVTEFVKEGSLRRILEKYPEGMKIEDVIELFTPIAAAIDCIHDNNIVHRDLKPENILISKTHRGYQVFVADFGFVKFTSASKQFQTEKTAGTWKYIPPEAWKADPDMPQTKVVDIYALGIILYEALEGKIPYADIGEVLSNKPALSPTRTLQNTDPFVVEYLLKAIHKDPEQRPASAREVIDGIRNAYEGNLSAEQRWLGRRIKQYVIDEVLGAGRMGISLRAQDTQTNKQVVLKAFTRSLSGNAIQAYDKERKSLERLENGHGVLIPHDRFEYEGYFFIVTEYQSGGTLRNLLNRKPKPATTEIMEIFSQIAEAIDYIHERKVVHRDIKPENIVYSVADGKIKPFITDFGVSVILASTQSSFRTHEIGTPRYMAPELWDTNARGTKAVDIYAFGIMLYEALEGRAPFDADAPAIIKQHLYLSVPVPEKTLKELGVNARNVLLQSLAKDAEERPKTAAEVMQQIKGQHAMFLGKKYGKYIIEKFVGRGTYGATYRAYDRNKNQRKKFAFKVLSVPEPMMNEVDSLKKLGHFDGILPILDGNSENGIHYIVTEYLNGLNLRDMLQSYRQGMSLDDALKLFRPIARALDHLHNNDIVHGDLKPENIILFKNKNEENYFEPFITGFGISKIAGKVQSFYSKSNINYIAPELWEDTEPTRASDIFALSVIIYETLVGVPPFDAKSPAHIMKKYLTDGQPEVKNLTKLYGRNTVKALLQALNKKPERRQKYAQEFISGLERREPARTPTKAGRVSGQLLTTMHSLINVFRRNSAASILAVMLLITLVSFGAYIRSRPTIPTTGLDFPPPTATLDAASLTENPPATEPSQADPSNPPTTNSTITPLSPSLGQCQLNYPPEQASEQEGWPKTYVSNRLISVEDLYREYYGRKRDNLDLYAFVYYNNRQAIETGSFSSIDPGRLSIEKGWTIFLPAPSWIDEYKKFPVPVLERPGDNLSSTLTLAGSSTLSPLSTQIADCFDTAKANEEYNINIQLELNNTISGLTEFCQSTADLFVASEEITSEMRRESGCRDVELLQFGVAKYAVVIFLYDSNPYAQQLRQDPLNSTELERLLFSAMKWGEVREGWGNEPILRFFPPVEGGAFEIVRSKINPTVDTSSEIGNLSQIADTRLIPQEVARNQFSIGFSGFGDYQSRKAELIAIPIDQVLPNVGTIQGEKPIYPLTRSLYLYTGETAFNSNPLLRYFINYYLSYQLDFLTDLGYFRPDAENLLNAHYHPRMK